MKSNMTDKTTTSARLGELEWRLSEYDDKQGSRVLSCSAGDVTASLSYNPDHYVSDTTPEIITLKLFRTKSGNLGSSHNGSFMVKFFTSGKNEDVYKTEVFDVVNTLMQNSNQDATQGLVNHWLIVLAERLIEVVMCTDTSTNPQSTIVEFLVGDLTEINLTHSVVGLVHKIKPGHVGATAALIGNVVYRLPICKSIDELLETVRFVGIDSLRMKGSLTSPAEETKFFYNTSNIVTSSIASCRKTEVSQQTTFNKYNDGVYFYIGRPPKRLSFWELLVSQATATSQFTDDPGVISASMIPGGPVYYYEDEMKFESLLMSVFDEISPSVVEDVGSVVRTGNYLRSSEILMCSVSEVLVRYAMGGTGAFSSKKDHNRSVMSKESYSSVIRNNQNTAGVMTRKIITDQGYNLYNVEDMMLGVVKNISAVCSWVDSIVERNTNDDSHDSVMSPAVVTMSAGEALNRCIRSMKDWSFDETDDAYEFTMNLILCLMQYLNELVLLSCEDMEARFYDSSDYDKMKQGRAQTVKTAIDLLKALESADNRTCQNQ